MCISQQFLITLLCPLAKGAGDRPPFASLSKRVVVETIRVKMCSADQQAHFHTNKTHFHMKGFKFSKPSCKPIINEEISYSHQLD